MAKSLPSRPHLDHLRRQAKTLLARARDGEVEAARAFIAHLPAAKTLTPAKVKSAGFRLADAQAVVARQTGFGSWPLLARHVAQLRALEGEWQFAALEVDGASVPAAAIAQSLLLIDGDRFRMESPEATYEGEFTIDVGESPARIDIAFVEGPESGKWSYGIYEIEGDRLGLCLGLVGASRPVAFKTTPGSGHALERLRRASKARPIDVTGGTRAAAAPDPAPADAPTAASDDQTGFDDPMTPALARLEGEWRAQELATDGKPMPAEWLSFGSRVAAGREVKVVFGGQVMLHAKVRLDEAATPVAIDYLHLAGSGKGRVSYGILEWIGDEARILMPPPGLPRPTRFDQPGKGTLSRWKKSSSSSSQP